MPSSLELAKRVSSRSSQKKIDRCRHTTRAHAHSRTSESTCCARICRIVICSRRQVGHPLVGWHFVVLGTLPWPSETRRRGARGMTAPSLMGRARWPARRGSSEGVTCRRRNSRKCGPRWRVSMLGAGIRCVMRPRLPLLAGLALVLHLHAAGGQGLEHEEVGRANQIRELGVAPVARVEVGLLLAHQHADRREVGPTIFV